MAPGPSRNVVLLWTPAKVNLFLEVRAKRPDGFHEVESLMAAVTLFDTLELRPDPSGGLSLRCSDESLSVGDDNLVVRAAKKLRERTGSAQGASIRLTKRIPMVAGLAGGSSDAAATLKGLNELWRLELSSEELAEVAAELGSDVAFFLGGPAAWATGRGERLETVTLGRPLDLVIAVPPTGCSTAEVYGRLRVPAAPMDGRAVRDAAEKGDIDGLGRALFNRLEGPAMEMNAAVREVHRRLEDMGTAGARMSGSGSALFALCRDRREAMRVTHALRDEVAAAVPGLRVVCVRTCS